MHNYYLIMEYCYEGDLFSYVEKVDINEEQIAFIMYQSSR